MGSSKTRVIRIDSETLKISVGDKDVQFLQGCLILCAVFYMDAVVREGKIRLSREGVQLEIDGEIWKLMACLYADDNVVCRKCTTVAEVCI